MRDLGYCQLDQRMGGGFGGGRSGGTVNQDWVNDRQAITTATLSTVQKQKAKEQFDERRKFWASLQGLTPEQRVERYRNYLQRTDH
ncbi:MAG: hypothetical protein ABIP97_07640 [Chthoniobacterales bacterium]